MPNFVKYLLADRATDKKLHTVYILNDKRKLLLDILQNVVDFNRYFTKLSRNDFKSKTYQLLQ